MLPLQRDAGANYHSSVPIRLLVADPQPLFCEALVSSLEADRRVETARWVTDEASAVELVASIRPHLVLTELELNPGSGLRLTRRVREATRVVVLTRRDVGDVLLDVVSAGAVGCLGHVEGVVETQRLVLDSNPNEFTIAPGRLLGALRGAATGALARVPDSPLLRLTAREREVLSLLAAGLDNDGIARSLYVSPETARTHVRNLLRKLGLHSRADAALLALRSGFGQPDSKVLRIQGPDLGTR